MTDHRTHSRALAVAISIALLLTLVSTTSVAASTGGPLVLMGIDAEDGGPGGHGPIANYVQVVNSILGATSTSGDGIAVFGNNNSIGSFVTNFWNTISADTGEAVTYIPAADIGTVDLSTFQMLAVVSDFRNTFGGLSPSENIALGGRRADIADFVNAGGGLLGFSSQFASFEGGPYPYLADIGAFTFSQTSYLDINPTAEGLAIGITDALDVCCWHDQYETFPAFLRVLATNASTGKAAAIGGVNVFISDIQLAPPTQSHPVGNLAEVTATVNENGSAVVGTTVTFEVISGPNAGTTGTESTDSAGQASFTYGSTGPGTDTLRASFVDSQGGTQLSNTVLVEWEQDNQPPLASAGGPYSGDEGTPVPLSGSASDPDSDPLTISWSYVADASVDAGTTCAFSDVTVLNPDFECTDDGLFHVTLTVDDGVNTAVDSVAVTVLDNLPPDITEVAPSTTDPVAVNTSVGITAPFTDPGTNDTHTCSIDWGPTSGAGTVAGGECTGTNTYTAAGIYTVEVTVTDDDGGSDTAIYEYVVVYDPDAGFVTGGGWIDSPEGAYTADTSLSGKANFGFVSKYKKGATVPDGQTQFQFHAAAFNFHSTSYEWLVIAGPKAQYKGSGTINGAGDYGFMLTANDGQVNGGGDVDRLRFKVWDKTTSEVIYDNQISDADDGDATDAIEGGSIVIHSKKK